MIAVAVTGVLIVVIVLFICILFRETVPQLNPRCVATYEFTKALVAKETPQIYERFSLGYLHIYTLVFKEVKIELEFNDIRREWSLEIWCYAAQQHLFWHTCTQARPVDAINLLVEKYNICEKLKNSLLRRQEYEAKANQAASEVIRKTLQ